MGDVRADWQRVMDEITELRTEFADLAAKADGRSDDEDRRFRDVAYQLRIADDDRASLEDRLRPEGWDGP